MVLEKLSNSLRLTVKKIASSLFVDETLINDLIKDLQRALLQADVNVQLVFDLSKSIKARALEEKGIKGINQKDHLIKIVYEELVRFLGKEKHGLKILDKKPYKIMAVGFYGSGKTTTIAKIAKYYQKRGYNIATIALDVHRPAAIDQLIQLSSQINVKCFYNLKEKNPKKIYQKFKNQYDKYDILFIDTAGRHELDSSLKSELKELNRQIAPDEKLLIVSADVGQAALAMAQGFYESCQITGIVITKLDGTAKAGGALSAASVTSAPIKFIGTGEKIDDIEEFDPVGFVSRLLGMGDIKALLEKAEESISKEQAEDLGRKFIKGDFNFIDLYEQMEAMSKMGPLSKIMDLIPGLGNMNVPKDMINVQESKLKKWKFMLQSMTKKELENPDILSRSRIDRIAKGSGTLASEVRELIKQYKQSKKLVKVFKGMDKEPDMTKLMKKFSKKIPQGLRF